MNSLIITITGKVQYPITLDPSVWIFDDRKIPIEAFGKKVQKTRNNMQPHEIWEQDHYQQKIKPPIKHSVEKMAGRHKVDGTFLMPIADFIERAAPLESAVAAELHSGNSRIRISLEELAGGYMLFAQDGKQLKDEGPVHFFSKSDRELRSPVKAVQQIVIF